MLPWNVILLLGVIASILVVVRYATAWRFFRAHAGTLEGLAMVPWPLRSKLSRPSYSDATSGLVIVTKLLGLLIMAPAMVSIALWIAPEQVTRRDLFVAATSLGALLFFMIGDRIAMRRLRARYDVPDDWRSLLH